MVERKNNYSSFLGISFANFRIIVPTSYSIHRGKISRLKNKKKYLRDFSKLIYLQNIGLQIT